MELADELKKMGNEVPKKKTSNKVVANMENKEAEKVSKKASDFESYDSFSSDEEQSDNDHY